MRACACFYCGKDYENDERTLGDTWGIRYCADHKAAAKRDSNAYLHKAGRVKLSFALAHPVLGPFLEALQSETHIRRSSGAVEGRWTLHYEVWNDDKALVRTDGEWYVPMIHRATETRKGVSIRSLLDERIASLNDASIAAQIPEVLTVLDAGVYAEDYAAFLAAGTPGVVGETKGVVPVIANGTLGRIFVPTATS
jgi:hypothetical protein